MNHRERVVAALRHQEPDQVPIDFGGTRSSSIVATGYEALKAQFGIEGGNVITSGMMQIVDVDERILQALDIDTRTVTPMGPPDVVTGEHSYRDEWGVERVNPPGSYYYDQVAFPLSGSITVADIARYRWPDPHDPVRRKGLKERVAHIHDDLGCAAVLLLPAGFVHTTQYLRGFEDWYVDVASDKKLLEALFDAVLEVNLEICRTILDEVGAEVDVLVGSDDLGLEDRLLVPPAFYREVMKPRHRRYFQLMHDLSPARVFFHTCGSVADIVEDLIEIGVDVLNPIQVTAAGMEPSRLKRLYGERLAFWGAIDTRRVLNHGSTGDVEAEVERRIEELGRGGGYVLAPVHNIQPDVPVANILAMYHHAREYVPSYKR